EMLSWLAGANSIRNPDGGDVKVSFESLPQPDAMMKEDHRDALKTFETPDAILQRKEEREWIRGLVEKLPAPEHSIVARAFYERKSDVQIAQLLRLSNRRVGQIKKAALRKLAKLICQMLELK